MSGMARERVKKLIPTLIMAVVLLGLVSPVVEIDHPVEPFKKAKVLVT